MAPTFYIEAQRAHFDPSELAGARLRPVADCEIAGPLRLLGPLLRVAIRRTDGGQLRDLKGLLE